MDPPPVEQNTPPLKLLPGRHYHFLGIGGVGMSGLAEVLHRRGIQVSGSDAQPGDALTRLAELGIPVQVGHAPEHLESVQAVIHTSAIGPDHPMVKAASARGVPVYHRAELLGALTRQAKTLAVAGTHGKTTSTGWLAHVLTSAGLDPTALVGGHLPQFGGGNVRMGGGQWLVVEADESDGSFVHLSPHAVLLTNIEADHLDQHGNLAALVSSFRAFLETLPSEGVLVFCADDPLAQKLAEERGGNSIGYGAGPGAQVKVKQVADSKAGMTVTLEGGSAGSTPHFPPHKMTTPLGGAYNALNLAGVFAMGCAMGIPEIEVVKGLETFEGVARRQQFLGKLGGCRIFDDYAHHPTEVRVTLTAFLERYGEPLTVIFQPHLYSRTRFFAREFAEALRPATRVFVTDIYGAREAPMEGVSAGLILDGLAGHPAAFHLPNWRQGAGLLAAAGALEGVVVTMGAGDITGLGPLLLRTKEQA